MIWRLQSLNNGAVCLTVLIANQTIALCNDARLSGARHFAFHAKYCKSIVNISIKYFGWINEI